MPAARVDSLEPVRDQLDRRHPAGSERPALRAQGLGGGTESDDEQRGRLVARESKVGRGELQQFTPTASRAKSERRQSPSAEHDVHLGRRLQAERAQEAGRRVLVGQLIDVVEHQHRGTLDGIEPFADRRRLSVGQRHAVRCADRRPRPGGIAGQAETHRLRDVCREHLDLPVGGLEREPARRRAGTKLAHRGRLAVAPSGDDQRDPAPPGAGQYPLQSWARDDARRVQLETPSDSTRSGCRASRRGPGPPRASKLHHNQRLRPNAGASPPPPPGVLQRSSTSS